MEFEIEKICNLNSKCLRCGEEGLSSDCKGGDPAEIAFLISFLFLIFSLKLSELMADDIYDRLKIKKAITMTIVMLIIFLLHLPILFIIYLFVIR